MNLARLRAAQMRDGAWLVAWGLFQKVFVADNLSGIADAIFARGTDHTGINVLLGVYAFAFQIYGDFAGYSNIARGISKLMGIELMENFRFPYLVRTPQEFWRHWHISLSTWLRDYLYIPLGGNRGSARQTDRNLLITMVLGGLWHGAAWTFVLWGLFHGLLLIAYRSLGESAPFRRALLGPGPLARVAGWAVMFHFTCLGWLIFRARSVGQLADLTRSLVFDFAPTTLDVQACWRRCFSIRRHCWPCTPARPISTTCSWCGGCRSACDTLSTPLRSTSRCSSVTSADRISSTFSSEKGRRGDHG